MALNLPSFVLLCLFLAVCLPGQHLSSSPFSYSPLGCSDFSFSSRKATMVVGPELGKGHLHRGPTSMGKIPPQAAAWECCHSQGPCGREAAS